MRGGCIRRLNRFSDWAALWVFCMVYFIGHLVFGSAKKRFFSLLLTHESLRSSRNLLRNLHCVVFAPRFSKGRVKRKIADFSLKKIIFMLQSVMLFAHIILTVRTERALKNFDDKVVFVVRIV